MSTGAHMFTFHSVNEMCPWHAFMPPLAPASNWRVIQATRPIDSSSCARQYRD